MSKAFIRWYAANGGVNGYLAVSWIKVVELIGVATGWIPQAFTEDEIGGHYSYQLLADPELDYSVALHKLGQIMKEIGG